MIPGFNLTEKEIDEIREDELENIWNDAMERERKINEPYFLKKLKDLLPKYEGTTALMHDKKIICFYEEYLDAYYGGYARYTIDGVFSVHEVTMKPKYVQHEFNSDD